MLKVANGKFSRTTRCPPLLIVFSHLFPTNPIIVKPGKKIQKRKYRVEYIVDINI